MTGLTILSLLLVACSATSAGSDVAGPAETCRTCENLQESSFEPTVPVEPQAPDHPEPTMGSAPADSGDVTAPADATVSEDAGGTVEPDAAAPMEMGPRSQMLGECPIRSVCTDLGVGGLDACVPDDALGFDPLTNGRCTGSCDRLLAWGVLYEQRCMRPSASYPLEERWCVVICYQ